MKNVEYRTKGFTLLELLVYLGILAVVGTIGISIYVSISRSYTRVQAQNEVTQSLRLVAQSIQQAIRDGTQVNTASGTTLSLGSADTTKNPTVFTLSNNVLYRQEGVSSAVALSSGKVDITSLNFSVVSTQQTFVDPVDHWAWNGDGGGWVDFNPTLGSIRVPLGAGDFYGYAYMPSIDGYISLNCDTTASCGTVSYKVTSSATGTLAGWAWSDQYGWFSFNSGDTTSSVPYSVTISSSTGDFAGWAWSENLGWLSFNSVDTTSSVAYKVKAARKLGRPLNSVRVTITAAYHAAANSLYQYSDTNDFSIALSQPSFITISSISPSVATTTVSVAISGTNFQSGASAKFSRPGLADILPTAACTVTGTTSINCSFDVTGKTTGTWDVMAINPDGEIGLLPDGFTIQ